MNPTKAERSLAASILGGARSAAKAKSSRANGSAPCRPGRKRGRPKKKPEKLFW